MPSTSISIALDRFATFGDLPRYLRRRAGSTQCELSMTVGYSDTQISRLEQNERLPDLATLLATWQRRRERTMTLSGYTASGGVRGAIAETTEAVFYDQLEPEQRDVARQIFLRMTRLGEETSTVGTRRQVSFDELISKPGDSVGVVETNVAARATNAVAGSIGAEPVPAGRATAVVLTLSLDELK